MGKGYKLVHSILRGLRSSSVKKLISHGLESIVPGVGTLMIEGTERLRGSGLGELAEKITDTTLRGLAALPDSAETLGYAADAAEELLEQKIERDEAKKSRKAARRRMAAQISQDDIDMMAPYNHQPNATYVDPRLSYRAMATLSGDRGSGRGSGVLVYGNDQPFMEPPRRPTKLTGRSQYEKESGYEPHPINRTVRLDMTAKNSFGYQGAPGISAAIPNPKYSVAGQYFRPTGRGTNVRGAIAAYGVDDPEPRPMLPRTAEKRAPAKTPKKKGSKPRKVVVAI